MRPTTLGVLILTLGSSASATANQIDVFMGAMGGLIDAAAMAQRVQPYGPSKYRHPYRQRHVRLKSQQPDSIDVDVASDKPQILRFYYNCHHQRINTIAKAQHGFVKSEDSTRLMCGNPDQYAKQFTYLSPPNYTGDDTVTYYENGRQIFVDRLHVRTGIVPLAFGQLPDVPLTNDREHIIRSEYKCDGQIAFNITSQKGFVSVRGGTTHACGRADQPTKDIVYRSPPGFEGRDSVLIKSSGDPPTTINILVAAPNDLLTSALKSANETTRGLPMPAMQTPVATQAPVKPAIAMQGTMKSRRPNSPAFKYDPVVEWGIAPNTVGPLIASSASFPPKEGKLWRTKMVKELGVRLLAQEAKSKSGMNEEPGESDTVEGIVSVSELSELRDSILHVSKDPSLDIKDAIRLEFIETLDNPEARDSCVVVPILPYLRLRNGKEQYEIRPTGQYSIKIEAAQKNEDRDFGCGVHGKQNHNAYFEYHPYETKKNYVWVDVPENGFFDPRSLQLLDIDGDMRTSPPSNANLHQSGSISSLTQTDDANKHENYIYTINRRILSSIRNSSRLQEFIREGKIAVSFDLNNDGYLSKIVIEKKSGVPGLDEVAIEAIRNASPFPLRSGLFPTRLIWSGGNIPELPTGVSEQPPEQSCHASAGTSPSDAIRAMLDHVIRKRPSDDVPEATFYSDDLNRFVKAIKSKKWEEFDADPITGNQEPDEVSCISITSTNNVVSVVYKDRAEFRVDYIMVSQNGAWKINDIFYFAGKKGSFRSFMM
jgi:TonB family protein